MKLLIVSLVPLMLYANMGTALILFTGFHLLFGNILIAILEGGWLSRRFNLPIIKTIFIITVANYFSAWIGVVLLRPIPYEYSHLFTINNLSYWLFISIIVSFFLTLFIEFPFFKFALREIKISYRETFKTVLKIQLVSYTILFLIYFLVSNISMLSQLKVVSPQEMNLPKNYHIYYISQDAKKIYRNNLQGTQEKLITNIDVPSPIRLFVRKEDNLYSLYLLIDQVYTPRDFHERLILKNFTSNTVETPLQNNKPDYSDFGKVPKLNLKSPITYEVGFWANKGIRVYTTTKELFNFAIETPFVSWSVGNATHIKNDLVIFQLGNHQICILNPHNQTIALITQGKGVIVSKD